jgi:hypothetical protein
MATPSLGRARQHGRHPTCAAVKGGGGRDDGLPEQRPNGRGTMVDEITAEAM